MSRTRVLLIAIPYCIALAAVQATFLTQITLLGHILQLLVIGALAWGLLRGPGEGMLFALVAGLTLDLYSLTPFGLNSIAIMLSLLAIGLVQFVLPENRTYLPIALGTLGTVIFLFLQAALSQLVGLNPYWGFFTQILGYAATQAIGFVIIYPLFSTIVIFLYPEDDPRQLGRASS